ncbi:hypothetical protein OTU49_011475, partial [Cherax quadricarinatus]
ESEEQHVTCVICAYYCIITWRRSDPSPGGKPIMTSLDEPLLGGHWGLLSYHMTNSKVEIVELVSALVHVNIHGFVAQVSAKLRYHNPGDSTLMVEYVLPVDENAALYKFEAHLDGQTVTTICIDKEKASKVFHKAVSSGQAAFLVRQDNLTSDILHLALGSFPGGSYAELNLSLIMKLKVETDGAVNFVLPAILNPRYCPSHIQETHTDRLPGCNDGKYVVVTKAYVMSIESHISGDYEIARIISHTDRLMVTISEDTKSAKVTQDGDIICDHDWSLVIYYSNPYKTHVLQEVGDHTSSGFMNDNLIMINIFPEIPANSYSNKNEIIFFIDCSESMVGKNIKCTRVALLLFLKSLPMDCLFNIVTFGTDFSFLFPEGSRKYNEETLAEACVHLESLEANMGGTEMFLPLQEIYSQPPKAGYFRQILLISDGDIYNVDEVIQLVGRNAHETRVFAVGVGEGASTILISGVARAGRGRSEIVLQPEQIQDKVIGFIFSMVQETVQNVQLVFEVEPNTTITLVPQVPPIIFGGQHLVVYAKVPSTSTVKAVSVMGSIRDTEINTSIKGSDIITVDDAEKSLHLLAAQAQINQWQLCEEDVANDIIELSVATGVLSKLTALVGVNQRGKLVKQSLYNEQDVNFMAMVLCRAPSHLLTQDLIAFGADTCCGSHICYDYGILDWEDGALGSSYGAFGCGNGCGGSGTSNWKEAEDECDGEAEAVDADFLAIVVLQCFDGSWTLEDAAKFCMLPFSELKDCNPTKNETTWATAIVLILLENKYSEIRKQWTLLAIKARNFISNSREDVDALVKKAQSVLV